MKALACAVLLVLALPAPAARAACPRRAFVLGSDYTTGTLSVVDLDTRVVHRDVAVVSGDPVARWHDGRLYVVNRYSYDNVQVIDPGEGYATVAQFSVGNGSNPQDIAFASAHKAYVSRLGDPALLIVDPATGTTLGSLSLARFADADGNPEAAHMAVVGDLLFVALGRLANFVPADTGLVAVVDTRADTLLDVDPATPGVQALRLHATNPWTDFARLAPPAPGGDTHLLVGCTGRWGAPDGGIEDIVVPADAGAGGIVRAAGLLATEAALGGDVVDVVADGRGHPYAVASDATGNTSLVAWDAASGAVTATLFAPGGFSIADVAPDGCGGLALCDGSYASPGLRLYATPADSLVAVLDTGLPPVSVAFDDGTSSPPGPDAPVLALGAPAPNPAADQVRFTVDLARAARVDIGLYDVGGRRVLALAAEEMPGGTSELVRSLSTPDGRRLTPGVYVLRARAGSSEVRRRVVVVR